MITNKKVSPFENELPQIKRILKPKKTDNRNDRCPERKNKDKR